jgi:hypothetical protein
VKDTSLLRGRDTIILLEGYQGSPSGPSDKGTIFQCSQYSDWLRAGRPRGHGLRVPVRKIFFSSPLFRDGCWGQPSLLSSWYRGQGGRGVKLNTQLQLVPMSRIRGSIYTLPPYISMAWCTMAALLSAILSPLSIFSAKHVVWCKARREGT